MLDVTVCACVCVCAAALIDEAAPAPLRVVTKPAKAPAPPPKPTSRGRSKTPVDHVRGKTPTEKPHYRSRHLPSLEPMQPEDDTKTYQNRKPQSEKKPVHLCV